MEVTIDLKEIINMILKRWWIIVIAALICTIATAIVSFFFLTPVYQSNTTLYIGKKVDTDKNTDLAYNDLLLGSQLVKDYRELVKSRLVANQVMKDLNLSDITVEGFSAKLSVELKNDTRVIQISAEDKDPVMASTIANKVADVFIEKVVDIMQVENVKIIDRAEVPDKAVKPKKLTNIAIAFVLGLVLGFGIVFLIEFLDNTVKTPEDIKKYLDLPVIGTIPVFPEN